MNPGAMALLLLLMLIAAPACAADGPGVTVRVLTDYAPGRYTGPLTPSPPHADGNPRRAIEVAWPGRAERLIFSHEESYCPVLELPSGAAMCNQFFEGNLGDAELFNDPGRKESNSWVEVVSTGPRPAWVRWHYRCVNMRDDTRPRLQATEDYYAYPNGLTLRRMAYRSLMPDRVEGYSTQPVELFGIGPVGSTFRDLFPAEAAHGGHRVLTVVELFGKRRYDVFWGADGSVRRRGTDADLTAIAASRGYALIMPFRDRLLFAAMGPASGFAVDRNQLIDHCTSGALGGCEWGQGIWDHWPIGWLNSQTSNWKEGSAYPYSFGSIGQFFVPPGRRIGKFSPDYFKLCEDMENNHWTENRTFAVLLGGASTEAEIVRLGRRWLEHGPTCLQPGSVEKLR
jgi:hypothetical protein